MLFSGTTPSALSSTPLLQLLVPQLSRPSSRDTSSRKPAEKSLPHPSWAEVRTPPVCMLPNHHYGTSTMSSFFCPSQVLDCLKREPHHLSLSLASSPGPGNTRHKWSCSRNVLQDRIHHFKPGMWAQGQSCVPGGEWGSLLDNRARFPAQDPRNVCWEDEWICSSAFLPASLMLTETLSRVLTSIYGGPACHHLPLSHSFSAADTHPPRQEAQDVKGKTPRFLKATLLRPPTAQEHGKATVYISFVSCNFTESVH